MNFTVNNQTFSSLREAKIYSSGTLISNWYLASKTKTDSENIIKYGIQFDPTQKYINTLWAKYWSDNMKSTYNSNYSELKEVVDLGVPTMIEDSGEINNINYFSIIELDSKEYIFLEIPENIDSVKLYDTLLNQGESSEELEDITISFDEELEVPYTKILLVVYAPNSIDAVVNISAQIYKKQVDPLRNKKDYFIRNDYFRSNRDKLISSDIKDSENNLLIEPINHIILGTKKQDQSNYPILQNKLNRSIIDDTYQKWNSNVVYNYGDTVICYGKIWKSICDGNIGLHPELSNFWINEDNLAISTTNQYSIEILGETGKEGELIGDSSIVFSKTSSNKVFIKSNTGDIQLTAYPKIGYELENFYTKSETAVDDFAISSSNSLKPGWSIVNIKQTLAMSNYIISVSDLNYISDDHQLNIYAKYKQASNIVFNFEINQSDIIPMIYVGNPRTLKNTITAQKSLFKNLTLTDEGYIYTISDLQSLNPRSTDCIALCIYTKKYQIVGEKQHINCYSVVGSRQVPDGWVYVIDYKLIQDIYQGGFNLDFGKITLEQAFANIVVSSDLNIETDTDEKLIPCEQSCEIRYYNTENNTKKTVNISILETSVKYNMTHIDSGETIEGHTIYKILLEDLYPTVYTIKISNKR